MPVVRAIRSTAPTFHATQALVHCSASHEDGIPDNHHPTTAPQAVHTIDPICCLRIHPHITTGKTIALTKWTFVGKVMSLFLNMLSRLVITFLPRSKRFNFMAAVTIRSDFGAQKNKV